MLIYPNFLLKIIYILNKNKKNIVNLIIIAI